MFGNRKFSIAAGAVLILTPVLIRNKSENLPQMHTD